LIDKNGFSISILKTFWIRRWFRTLPTYFLILITLCIIHLLFDDGFTLRSATRYFIFSQNLFTEHPSLFFPEAWTLAIEEWFYLIFPILIFFTFLFIESYQKSLLGIALLVIVFITAFRFYRFSNVTITGIKDWDLIFRKQVITRLDSLMFGVVGAYISYFHKSLWIKFKTQLLFAGIIIFIASKFLLPKFTTIDGIYSCVFSFTLYSIGTLFMLPYLSELKTGNGLLYKPITYISLISYSMYLLNLSIVAGWIIGSIPWEEITNNIYLKVILNYSIYWLLVIGLSILIYKYFEIPMTSLRERFK
jgi:peptidoglycan/LPS O-acetylase OafA/YrhL